jgi:hypothetical protein
MWLIDITSYLRQIEDLEEFAILDHNDQHQLCLELPAQAFVVLSQSLVQSHLGQFIAIYRGMAENATYSWSFAETIANNMKVLFDSEDTLPADKAEALRVAIISAKRQNRFAEFILSLAEGLAMTAILGLISEVPYRVYGPSFPRRREPNCHMQLCADATWIPAFAGMTTTVFVVQSCSDQYFDHQSRHPRP